MAVVFTVVVVVVVVSLVLPIAVDDTPLLVIATLTAGFFFGTLPDSESKGFCWTLPDDLVLSS
jgi:hypothetical protein